MEMTYEGAMVMPASYAMIDADEMTYVDGGWSASQVVKNVAGLVAVFSLGYAGSAFHKFVVANKGLTYGKMLVKGAVQLGQFLWALPWQAKIVVGVCAAAVLWALGSIDMW